jgi:hypothetical protein
MHDPVAVRLFECRRDLQAMAHDLRGREKPPGHDVVEGFPLHEFHHEEVTFVLVRPQRFAADVVQHANVRMVEPGDGARLTLEPLTRVDVARNVGTQDFEGDKAIEPPVLRTIDFTHAAGSKRSLDLIWPESSARGQCHSERILRD